MTLMVSDTHFRSSGEEMMIDINAGAKRDNDGKKERIRSVGSVVGLGTGNQNPLVHRPVSNGLTKGTGVEKQWSLRIQI